MRMLVVALVLLCRFGGIVMSKADAGTQLPHVPCMAAIATACAVHQRRAVMLQHMFR